MSIVSAVVSEFDHQLISPRIDAIAKISVAALILTTRLNHRG